MQPTDRQSTSGPLAAAWSTFGRALAVATAALTSLVSLFFHAPIWIATLRGTIAFLAIVVVVRIVRWALGLQHGTRKLAGPVRLERPNEQLTGARRS